jgi:hypothetical protein
MASAKMKYGNIVIGLFKADRKYFEIARYSMPSFTEMMYNFTNALW